MSMFPPGGDHLPSLHSRLTDLERQINYIRRSVSSFKMKTVYEVTCNGDTVTTESVSTAPWVPKFSSNLVACAVAYRTKPSDVSQWAILKNGTVVQTLSTDKAYEYFTIDTSIPFNDKTDALTIAPNISYATDYVGFTVICYFETEMSEDVDGATKPFAVALGTGLTLSSPFWWYASVREGSLE